MEALANTRSNGDKQNTVVVDHSTSKVPAAETKPFSTKQHQTLLALLARIEHGRALGVEEGKL